MARLGAASGIQPVEFSESVVTSCCRRTLVKAFASLEESPRFEIFLNEKLVVSFQTPVLSYEPQ